MDDFFIRALVGGLVVALIAGPFGCLLTWRRMAFMGETIAHSSLLGVVLGIVLGIIPQYSILILALVMASILYVLDKSQMQERDVTLSVIAHGALAVGLFFISFLPNVRIDLNAYLFGNILTIDDTDLWIIFIGGSGIFMLLLFYWRSLIALTISPDLARVEKLAKPYSEFIFTLLIAVLIAIAMKITGLLLVSAILIIPAAAARPLSSNPEKMAVLASVIAMISVGGGLYISLMADVAANAAIIMVALIIFIISFIAAKFFRFQS